MDGSKERTGPRGDVEKQVREIKEHMPETYKAIQAKAGEIGREAYAFVRRGAAGQPNNFYAIERGRVVGTPFSLPDITADVAQCMVAFGARFVVMWGVAAVQKAGGGVKTCRS